MQYGKITGQRKKGLMLPPAAHWQRNLCKSLGTEWKNVVKKIYAPGRSKAVAKMS